jgi:hypothetical protein
VESDRDREGGAGLMSVDAVAAAIAHEASSRSPRIGDTLLVTLRISSACNLIE